MGICISIFDGICNFIIISDNINSAWLVVVIFWCKIKTVMTHSHQKFYSVPPFIGWHLIVVSVTFLFVFVFKYHLCLFNFFWQIKLMEMILRLRDRGLMVENIWTPLIVELLMTLMIKKLLRFSRVILRETNFMV